MDKKGLIVLLLLLMLTASCALIPLEGPENRTQAESQRITTIVVDHGSFKGNI
ncbi:hypothetical protein J4212_00465 [Candidatus Woesearchaeota archaeon]|nr:hypothetical protein [Candidatus Woesearchaeota archaeon]